MADFFEQNGTDDGRPEAGSTQIFRMPSSDATIPDLMGGARQQWPTLTIVKGPQTGVTFTLDQNDITLGRDPSNSVFLNDMTVSRHHARMDLAQAASGVAMIEDLGSLNGTWVDGSIVNKAMLHEASTVQIGTFRMIFHYNNANFRVDVEG